MTTRHEYLTFARDHSLSFSARGLLTELVQPNPAIYGITVAALTEIAPHGQTAVRCWLDELAAAGYVQEIKHLTGAVWRATEKAFETTVEYV